MPFVLADTAGRRLRIPASGTGHPNGVTGTAGVSVSVQDIDGAARQFETMFGAAAAQPSPLHPAERALRYRVGPHWLDVLERPHAPEGMVSMALACPSAADVRWLGPAALPGAGRCRAALWRGERCA